jgi:hypothetical protein
MLEKGIILTPDFNYDGSTLTIRGLSGQTIRQALLYWDKIDFPENNIIRNGAADLQLLIDEGILQRTKIESRDIELYNLRY